MSDSAPHSDSHCYHCHLPIEDGRVWTAQINGEDRPMCCPGCKTVAEAIAGGGLTNYYQYRTEPASQQQPDQRLLQELELMDRDDIQADFVRTLQDEGLREANLLIEGITCAACIWLLENHISSQPGVESFSVNLSTHGAELRWDPETTSLSKLLLAVHQIGYKPHPWRSDHQEHLLRKEQRQAIRRLAVAGIGAMQVMMYAIALYAGAIQQDMDAQYQSLIRWVSALVSTPVVIYAAAPFFQAAWRDIKVRHLSMDVPVAIAIGGSWIASLWATWQGGGEVYYDSVSMFTFFLLLGRFLEMRARHRTSRSGQTLHNLMPASCLRFEEDRFVRVPVRDLKPGDKVRVLVGEAMPADGILLSGHTSVNESALTGEYMPVTRREGETVMAGSLNIEQPIELEVKQTGQETRISTIVRLLNRAAAEKPQVAGLADRIASWFVGAVLLTAVVVFCAWTWLGSDHAFWITLSVLVVTCPCALSLATPTALTAATGTLQKAGLLVTRGHVLETLDQVTHVVFDKTGTLTAGQLTLKEIHPCYGINLTKTELMNIASALEQHSEHPIARAFDAKIQLQADQVKTFTGEGLEGVIDGRLYRIGKPEFAVPGQNLSPPENEGQWLLLAEQENPICWFRLDDQLRPEAPGLVKQLQQLGLKVELLSGDREPVVAAMAEKLGIDRYQGAMSPDQKMQRVSELQEGGARVLMVGDGINDVPVLARADISLAMGEATDLARTSADAVLMQGGLTHISTALGIARQTRHIIRQNLGWALLYNLLALPLAAAGWIAPWMAAIGMATSSLIVVGNASRLSRMPVNQSAGKDTHQDPVLQQSPRGVAS
ncbi:heavy metal translocating P-type ATPase [Endozoicomonadaceae bacterium StTr2]